MLLFMVLGEQQLQMASRSCRQHEHACLAGGFQMRGLRPPFQSKLQAKIGLVRSAS